MDTSNTTRKRLKSPETQRDNKKPLSNDIKTKDIIKDSGVHNVIPAKSSNAACPKLSHTFKLQIIGVLVTFFYVYSYFLTGTFTWGIRSRFLNPQQIRQYMSADLNLTESELRIYNGSDIILPLYIGIDGDVYDVSYSRKIFGAGGSYNFFTGVDASRAYATGCFQRDILTHDLRGIDEDAMAELRNWKKFFHDHDRYIWVGRVIHPPIDPESPEPEYCFQLRRGVI